MSDSNPVNIVYVQAMDSCGVNHTDALAKVNLRIELERPEEVYYGGQYLKGQVKLELDDAIDITGLKLRLFGGCCTRWTNCKKPHPQTVKNKWHKEEEVYFDHTIVLWGHSNELKPCVEQLPVGKHTFPFNWMIPTGVPSSFEGDHGWVRYYSQCTLLSPGCRKGCKTTLVDTKHFTVLRHFDLNANKIYKEASKTSKNISVASHLCKAGRISVALLTPRAGYVAGENILADVDIHNMSSSKIKVSSLSLRQIIKYGADTEETCVEIRDLDKVYGDRVKARKHQCWTCRSIQIPPTVPSHLEKCNIIHVSYELLLTLERAPSNIYLKVPVYIGTIPPKDSYLTTWTYKEHAPVQESKMKNLIDSARFGIHASTSPWLALPHGTHFNPRYRYYHQATPRLKTKNILPLEASPGQRRRRSMFVCRTIRLKSHQWENSLLTTESVV